MARQKVAIEIEVIRGGNTQATVNAISQLELELDKLNKQIRAAKKEGRTDVYTKLRGETAGVKNNLSQLNKELRQQQKDFQALKFAPGSYAAISAEVSKLKREFQGLGKEAREGIAGTQLRNRIGVLTGDLKRMDAQMGTFTRNVGNYASAFRGLVPVLGAIGIGFGVNELVQQTRLAIKTFADFQQEIKTLQAISGATGEEMKALERNARRLGETTQFTALEVAKLQTNFARIGLTAPEILAATEATTNLAIATTENVERASEVMGAAINGFSLGADQAGRIGDVMTEAFNRTALSLDKWAEAQKFAATVATSAGVSIEGTAASMGILADAGLEGSNIGTVLRRIFSDLSTEGSKLAKEIGFVVKDTDDFTRAMKLLSEAGVDNSKAFQLVGRYAQSGLIALVNRADDIGELTTALENANGAAARTAAIVGDTLAQDMLKAKSAIEGLRINLVSTANVGLRSVVQGFTSLVDLLNRMVKIPVSEQLEAEQRNFNALVIALTDTNTSQETRNRLITELQTNYGAYIENIDLETASQEDLKEVQAEVNKQLAAKIALAALSEEVDKRARIAEKRRGQEAEKAVTVSQALGEAQDFLKDRTLSRTEALARLDAAQRKSLDVSAKGRAASGEEKRLADQLRLAIAEEAAAKEATLTAQGRYAKAQEEQARNAAILEKEYPGLSAAMEQIKKIMEGTAEETSKSTESADDLRKKLSALREELEDTPENSPRFQEISSEIEEIEKKLGSLGAAGPKAEKIIAGSLKALQKELTDLNTELENTPVGGQKFIDIIQRIQSAQQRLNEVMKFREALTFDAADFAGDPKDVEANVKALEEAFAFHEAINKLKAEVGVVDLDKAQDAIQRLELDRLASLRKQFKAGIITEEQYNREKERIAEQTELAILESRKSKFEVGSTEYLALVQQIADKEIAIEQAKNAKIEEDGKNRRQAIVNYAFQAADDVAGALIRVEENKVQRELDANIAALEEQYERRIELAEGNTEEQTKLEAELNARREALEKQAAQRRKEIAKKEAIINTALAVTKTIAELGFANPLVFVALAGQAIALAAQLATIESTQYARGGRISDDERKARGGKVKGKPHSAGGERFTVQRTGQRVELEGGEGVVNKRSMRSRDILSITGTPAQIISSVNAYKGYGVPFERSNIKPRILQRRGFFQTGGEIPANPQFVNPNQVFGPGAVNLEVSISDAQIDRLAERIARRTAKETSQAVETGIDNANRRKDRNTFVQNKTGIR